MELDSYLTPPTKTNSKWIKDLLVRPETLKLLEENLGGKLHGFGLDNNFMVITPKAQATKAKINKCDYIKQKIFCTVKEIISKIKRQHTKWKKKFANHIFDMNSKKQITQLKNQKELKQTFSQRKYVPLFELSVHFLDIVF